MPKLIDRTATFRARALELLLEASARYELTLAARAALRFADEHGHDLEEKKSNAGAGQPPIPAAGIPCGRCRWYDEELPPTRKALPPRDLPM